MILAVSWIKLSFPWSLFICSRLTKSITCQSILGRFYFLQFCWPLDILPSCHIQLSSLPFKCLLMNYWKFKLRVFNRGWLMSRVHFRYTHWTRKKFHLAHDRSPTMGSRLCKFMLNQYGKCLNLITITVLNQYGECLSLIIITVITVKQFCYPLYF